MQKFNDKKYEYFNEAKTYEFSASLQNVDWDLNITTNDNNLELTKFR